MFEGALGRTRGRNATRGEHWRTPFYILATWLTRFGWPSQSLLSSESSVLTGLMKLSNPEESGMHRMFRWTFRNCVKLTDGGDKQEQEKGYKWSFSQ